MRGSSIWSRRAAGPRRGTQRSSHGPGHASPNAFAQSVRDALAFAPLLLVSALECAKPGERILLDGSLDGESMGRRVGEAPVRTLKPFPRFPSFSIKRKAGHRLR